MVSVIIFLLTMVGMPLVIGRNFKENRISECYVYGLIIMMAVFEVLGVLCAYFKTSLTFLTVVYGVICLAMAVLAVIRTGIKYELPKILPGDIIIFAFVAFMVYKAVVYGHIDEDDSELVAISTTSLHTNTILEYDPYTGAVWEAYIKRILSPLQIMYAVISQVTGIHPAILAHTVLPVVIIPSVFIVFRMIAVKLFARNREKQTIMMLFLCVAYIFGNYTSYTPAMNVLLKSAQGKWLYAGLIIPLMIAVCIRAEKKEEAEGIKLTALSLAACLTTTIGGILTPFIYGSFGLCDAIKNKNVRELIYKVLYCAPCFVYALIVLVS